MLTPIKQRLAKEIGPEMGLDADKVLNLFEIPRDLSHGHLSVPVFILAKELKKAPPILAKEISEKLLTKKISGVASIQPVGGYINLHLDDFFVFTTVYSEVLNSKGRLGHTQVGKNKTVVIDYCSPNVAKPMHVGHLRATVIGQAIRNLAQTQGYKVIGINHLGDWGVQFGKLAYAYQLWGQEYDFDKEPFESLYKLYVRFHAESEKDPEHEKKGSLVFKQLEEGDANLKKLWQKFVDISLVDFNKQLARLNVKHDLVRGESFFNEHLKPTEKILEDKGLLIESEGAMVVDLTDEKMPPCLIRKSDGASLYATRDLAAAIYRFHELKADLNLYVVGSEQNLHFKQVFSVLKRMGFAWAKNCHHISFGLYRFKDMGKMSSRKGQIIRLDELLTRALELTTQLISEKNPSLENRDKIAEKVAFGAIIFNDLINDRVRDVEFDWDKALSFDGDSGPYLQYVHVRCQSILNKYNKQLPETVVALSSDEEKELLKVLLQYEAVLAQSFQIFKPNVLAAYLLNVASCFNKFYHNHRILGGESQFEASRIALVYITQQVIQSGLQVLNISAPEAM
jgi:arginyl-tRNA synthetase